MRKGQLSLDLMLAVLMFLLFIQVFQSISSNFIESTQEIAVLRQEKSIALSLYEKINYFRALNFRVNFNDSDKLAQHETVFKIPFILVPGKKGKQDCSIEFGPTDNCPENNICVKHLLNGVKEIKLNFKVNENVIPESLQGSEKNCGEKLFLSELNE
jgi:hypothetical protein